jgi:hypothetical protein
MDITEREEEFRKSVFEIGRMTYTKLLLDRFVAHWSEPDRGRGKAQKMRFEKQKTWDTKRRLATWARNNFDNIQCFLTHNERTIVQKRFDFAVSLEPYLHKYGKDMMNDFFRYWTQPENKRVSEHLRWELENFWETKTRLEQWAQRNNKF